MKRRLFNLLAALSLLLCVATSAFWLLTQNTTPSNRVTIDISALNRYRVYSVRGALILEEFPAEVTFIQSDSAAARLAKYVSGRRAIRVPYWLIAFSAAIAPSVWLARMKRRRERDRLSAGLCPTCGYDLRATPGRCPECGAVPAAAVISK